MMALFLSISSIGAFLAAILIKVLSVYTNWICEDINQCRLEYYFLLMAGISTLFLVIYIVVACKYPYSVPYFNYTLSREQSRTSRTPISRTDISDISDFGENYFDRRISSRLDLSRGPSIYDDLSNSDENEE